MKLPQQCYSITALPVNTIYLNYNALPGEPSPTRREAVKTKTAEYLMRAEQISSQHLKSSMGQGSTQTVVSGAICN